MAETSADDIRARCRRVIADYRLWAPEEPGAPTVTATLGEGHSNVTLLLTGTRRWVLRLARPGEERGVDRHRELLYHQRAAAAALAPPVLYQDPAEGILLTPFVGNQAVADTGDAPGNRDRREEPAAIAALLRGIHALDAALSTRSPGEEASPLDTPAYLRRWRAAMSPDPLGDLGAAEARALEACGERLRGAPPARLCHNDLIRANRLDDGCRLLAIDWEYARPGDPFFDLANAAWELDGPRRLQLLRRYLDRRETSEEMQRFADQLSMQAAIACCWYAARRQDTHWAQARQRLGAALRGDTGAF